MLLPICSRGPGQMPRKNEKTAPPFSSRLSEICDLLETAQKDYTWNKDQITVMEKLTQYYLHSLELDNLDYKGRAKIATKIQRCRIERREHKDTVTILEPLVQYLDSEKGKQLFNLLREVLGKTRKVEDRMENRVYYPRILDKEPIK